MTDLIPLSNAEFFWDAAPGELPTEFIVADRQRRLAARAANEADFTERLPKSLGAHVSGWLETPPRTPAGVFAQVFLSKLDRSQIESILNGLHEMARIEGQEWAGQIATALELTGQQRRTKPPAA